MAPRPKLAWTRSADVLWFGEPVACFRVQASGILGRHLSDAEYAGLCGVIRRYSMLLNHEYQTAPLQDHVKAASDVLDGAITLLDRIEAADQPQMGTIVTGSVGDAWADIYDHGAEFERNENSMAADIQALLLQHGVEPDAASQSARELLGGWKAGGQLVHPSQPADFIVLLREFCGAADLYNARLKSGQALVSVRGEAWVQHIGQVTEWMRSCGFLTGPSKGATYGNHGRITYLVKAINDQIPILTDEHGAPLQKQMRRPGIGDVGLAGSIHKAQNEYKRLQRRK